MIFKREISSLPTEILQYIFNFLNDTDLTSVSFVSCHWKWACERIFRHRCLKQIQDNILIEITSEQNPNVVDWSRIWFEWKNCQLIDGENITITNLNNISNHKQRTVMNLNNSIDKCYYVSEERIFIGNKFGDIQSRFVNGVQNENLMNENLNIIKNIPQKNIMDGGVRCLVGIPYYSLLLASGSTRLHFFDISCKRLQKLSTDCPIKPGCNTIKVFGPRFSTRDDAGVIHIYEIFYVSQCVRIAKILEVKQSCEVLDWQLWDTKLICLLSTGEVSVSSMLTYPVVEIYRSVCYSSILYKNPSWIFRDVVFVSTLASRGLVNDNAVHTYTYMSDMWNTRDGGGQWFIGGVDKLSDEALLEDEALVTSNYTDEVQSDLIAKRLLKGFCLHKHYLGSPVKEEISCMSMRRNLLCCGTFNGSVSVFKQVDTSTDPYADMDNSYNLHTKECVSDQTIQQVDISFLDGDVTVVYRTESTIGSFSLASQLQTFKPYLLEQRDQNNIQ